MNKIKKKDFSEIFNDYLYNDITNIIWDYYNFDEYVLYDKLLKMEKDLGGFVLSYNQNGINFDFHLDAKDSEYTAKINEIIEITNLEYRSCKKYNFGNCGYFLYFIQDKDFFINIFGKMIKIEECEKRKKKINIDSNGVVTKFFKFNY